jgi:hypothetical protein
MSDQGPTTRNLRLAAVANPHADGDGQLSTELDAIITIGRALSHIPDAETRARVIRWAIDRFGIDVTTAAEPRADLTLPPNLAPAAPLDAAAAESLNVDGLIEMFPQDDAAESRDEVAFMPLRSREPKRRGPTAVDRIRRALHWMGI